MSVINDYGVSGLFPSNVGGTGVAIKYFPRLAYPNGNLIFGTAPATPSATNAAGQLVVPGLSELNGQLWKVKAAGNVLPFTGGTTYQVVVQANTGTVAAPVYTTIADSGVITLAQATRSQWALDITLEGDTVSGQVFGYYAKFSNNANFSQVALNAALTGINFNASVPAGLSTATGGPGTAGGNAAPFGLVVGVVFATSLAQNAASLYQFQIIAD